MKNSLSAKQLEAFYRLCSDKSFSLAAEHLHITQSALSQRIIKLEQRLNRKLFIRNQNSVEITDSGSRLLSYCRVKKGLEDELLNDFNANSSYEVFGSVLICSFSSLVRSVIMPCLSGLVCKNPKVQLELRIKELGDLHSEIYRSQADFIISQEKLSRLEYDNILLGYEENVLIVPESNQARHDTILDHNINDDFTERFLSINKANKTSSYKRSFVNDIYGIIDGVRLGYGIGVVPLHMLKDKTGIRIEDTALKTPCYLQYKQSTVSSKLHTKIIECLVNNFTSHLH